MDQINANLDRISELSDDELKSLEGSIVSEFEAVQTQDLTPDVVESMKSLARAAVAVRNEVQQRVAQAQQLAAEAAEAAEAIKAINSDPDADGDADGDTDGDSDGSDDVVGDGDGEGEAIVFSDEAPAADATDAAPAPANDNTEDVNKDDETAAAEDPSDDSTDADPAPGSDAPDAPAAPDAETPASDEDPAQGGSDTPEQADLTDDDEKKVDTFGVEATEDQTEAAASAPVADEAQPEADQTEAASDAPAADDQPAPAEAPAADEAAAMSDNGTDAPAEPTSDADEEAEDKKNNSEDPVTASVTNELDNIEVQAPADHAPVVASASASEITYAPVTITAGADIPGVQSGSELPNTFAVAEAIIKRKNAMGRTSGGDGEMHHVAQFSTVFPEARQLSANDFEGNRAKVDGAVDSLVAAGGIAAPAEPRYELYGLGEDVRPVKDSLAVFGADRGGIRYITPPVLTDLNGAVSLWLVTDDQAAATGSTPVKPALRVAAGSEIVVNIEAVPLILTFGNMGARAYPELVERHTKLGMIQHARFAETRLLTRIGSLSTQVTAAKALGAARDIFVQVETAAVAYRSRHRMDEKTPLRAIFPSWFKAALRTDLVKQLPGDGMDETFGLTDATIDGWFNLRGINVTWTVDGETGQILGAQAAGALNSLPTTLVWYLFSEGTFLFLDGGTLDLGIVRDSTLNATNDYKVFFESFEAVAKVGIESLRVSSQLSIAGASTGTVAPTV